ncbi:OB-fold protein [Aliarcobacter cryaerophilus]|uniref:OB-fold protein n=1 Tax=Aliarcobacter cryaerophilus TaxID=28198 RepID=UPI003DA641AE
MKKLLISSAMIFTFSFANSLNTNEAELFKTILKDDLYTYVDGGESVLGKYATPINITNADTIQREYEQNEVFADEKYKNKNIVVNGVVLKVKKDMWNNFVIDLKGGSNMFINPSAQINKNYKNWLSNVQKDSEVFLVCTKSKAIATTVYLSNCIPSYIWARLEADKIMKNLDIIDKNEFNQYKNVVQKVMPHINKNGSCFKNQSHDNCMNEIKNAFSKLK